MEREPNRPNSTPAQLDCCQAHRELKRVKAELESVRRQWERTREEAEKASRAKSEFMANVRHEIRTPMNGILGFTRMLMKEPLTPDQRQKFGYVVDAGSSLLQVINNLLDFSKLAEGRLALSSQTFQLDRLIAEALQSARPSAAEKRIALQYHVAETIPQRLRGDRSRLRQVLTNLVDNAIKFTDRGWVHVRATLDEQSDRSALLRVVVTDTGIGIPAAQQEDLFESFSQADGSSTREYEGLGLGLAICKQLVHLMGGQIGFRSESGRGSSFWLTVNLEKDLSPESAGLDSSDTADDDAVEPETAASGSSFPGWNDVHLGQPRVLVADCDHRDRVLAEMLLGRAGCLVDPADNGREAMAMLESTHYDLVLIDFQMPGLNGLKVAENIRQREVGNGRHIPVVALAADAQPADRQQCLATGADKYVSKPITTDALLDIIDRYLPSCLATSSEEQPGDGSAVSRECPTASHAPKARNTEDCLGDLERALRAEDFGKLEDASARLKELFLEIGSQPLADQAIRVQFAARSEDLARAAPAVARIQHALNDRSGVATDPATVSVR